MGVNCAVIILFIIFSYVNPQDNIFLESEFNTWEVVDRTNLDAETDKSLTYLCENYYLTDGKKLIDCERLKLIPRAIEFGHEIHKRDIEELEGSGYGDYNPESKYVEIQSNNESLKEDEKQKVSEVENKFKLSGLENSLVKSKEAQLSSTVIEKMENNANVTTITTVSIEKPNKETKMDNKDQDDHDSLTTKPSEKLSTHSVVYSTNFVQSNSTTISAPGSFKEDKQSSPSLPKNTLSEGDMTSSSIMFNQSSATLPSLKEKEEPFDKTDSLANKNSELIKSEIPKVLPSDLAEVESNEPEKLNDKQSGNAVLLKSPKSETFPLIEGAETEKALRGLKENEQIIANTTEQPSTKESSKNINKASKDTTVLIVLFVVVLVIGGAAFTHNLIKKRKQKTANNELVNGIRASLQNLTSKIPMNTDVEQGTELKPLMNSSVSANKFSDAKKDSQS